MGDNQDLFNNNQTRDNTVTVTLTYNVVQENSTDL